MGTKGGNWIDLNAPITTSWGVKKLCRGKKQAEDTDERPHNSITKVYKELIGASDKVRWNNIVCGADLQYQKQICSLAGLQQPTENKTTVRNVQ